MPTDAEKALQRETEFLSGVEINFEAAKGVHLRGSRWKLTRDDDSDRLRALLASNRIFDRQKLSALPANRRIVLHGFERRFLLGKRGTGVAIGTVVSPLSHYASSQGGDAPPVGLGELSEHVRRLVGDVRVPHLIGVCSPSGFTEEARRAKLSAPNVAVVIIEPDSRGGWRTTACGDDVDPRVVKIFDPEGIKDKQERVRRCLEEHSVDLLTGGLTASTVAEKMGLPKDVVRNALRQAAVHDPELRVTEKEGELLLFRGAPVKRQERRPMNLIDRIRQLFSNEGDESAKINLLAERRAALAQRRDRMYEDIGKLEKKEAELFEQGKAAASQVPRRRIAAQLAQLRKDIARHNATAAMLNQQINIISTDIHNLTLLQQGKMAQLPDTEELTEHAVQAEEMLETLRADAELVGGLGTGIEEQLTSADEQAILKEFEAADQQKSAAKSPEPRQPAAPIAQRAAQPPQRTPTTRPAERVPDSGGADFGGPPPEPPRLKDPSRDRAGPEAT